MVEELKAELPQLNRFATLSPVPGFRRWVDRQLASGPGATLLQASEAEGPGSGDLVAQFRAQAEGAWWEDPARRDALRPQVLRLAAIYLTRPNAGLGTIDPVARFHLGNGARLERLNFLGDVSPNGLRQAHGLMVNYLYDLGQIEKNHEALAEKGRIAASEAVRAALPPAPQS